MICPLCQRELDKSANDHHLIPKSKKGSETVKLHMICHNKIHSLFDERELAKHYNSIERLLENSDIQKFVRWVAKKPIEYIDKNIMSNKHKWKRK